MSSDLDRMLRDAREALPEPGEDATQRVRSRSVATVRRRRRRARALVLVGAMLVAAVALGVTAGSLNAPTGTAAREPAVIGFVPEHGWFALQSPPPAVPGQQTAAVAANVPFAADDVVHGLVEPSGLPYSTLLSLPPRGIVLVATMTPETSPHLAPIPTNPTYPDVELPLRIRDGVPWVQWGAQVRPDEPLAQYQMRAKIRRYDVDVVAYFGTSRPSKRQLDAAQRQLEGLVVRSEGTGARRRPASAATRSGAVAVIDRTFECSTVLLGGLYQVEVRAHAGQRFSGQWLRLPYASVSTGGNAGRPDPSIPPVSSLAWISAGSPAPRTTVDDAYDAFVVQTGGTLGRNTELCRPSTARVELSRAGLRGGEIRSQISSFDCDVRKRVLVRIRATVLGTTAFRERGRIFVATGATASRAELAVRTPNGKLLAYASVDQTGRSRQYTASRGCLRES